MPQPTNPNYNGAEEAATPAAILHGNGPHNPQPTVTIHLMPGHTLQAQSIQGGIIFISDNGNTITLAAPLHNMAITADDDGSIHLQPMGADHQLFEAAGG